MADLVIGVSFDKRIRRGHPYYRYFVWAMHACEDTLDTYSRQLLGHKEDQ